MTTLLRRTTPTKVTSKTINSTVDSIVQMFTDAINKLDAESMNAQSAIEEKDIQISTLQEERTRLEIVKQRITSITDKMRTLISE